MPKAAIFILLAGVAVAYVTILWSALRNSGEARTSPPISSLLTGFVTNFFDTLGIGSFATTTAIFKFKNMTPDELIPGTLNVGHTLPVIMQAFIYISVIKVDVMTLALTIMSAVAGAWLGSGLVAGLSRRTLQLGMAAALFAAAAALLMGQFHLFPMGGVSLQLSGWRLWTGMAGNFVLGAVSTLGIGFYAPCITLVSLLGMDPTAAFPIMMGSSAFLMPVASTRFIWRSAYYIPVALGLGIGGLFAVPLAAFLVKSLPLTYVRWLVIIAVLYAAALMLRSSSLRSVRSGLRTEGAH